MQSSELIEKIEEYPSIKNYFDGVFSIDTLPKTLLLYHFLFCNQDLSSESGSHWLCFLCSKKGVIECFDSLGINDEKKALLLSFCKFKAAKYLLFNETPFQPLTSINCGLYVLFFAIQREHNLDLSFKTFLNETYETDLEKNEINIINFFDKNGSY